MRRRPQEVPTKRDEPPASTDEKEKQRDSPLGRAAARMAAIMVDGDSGRTEL